MTWQFAPWEVWELQRRPPIEPQYAAQNCGFGNVVVENPYYKLSRLVVAHPDVPWPRHIFAQSWMQERDPVAATLRGMLP